VSDVQRFNKICSHEFDEEIDLYQNRYIINAKSIMGIFSLNLLEPIVVIIHSSDPVTVNRFYERIKEWKTE
jgi:hypothetical protein